jgi:UDP-GlcNAc:undecaprenyl-phosphate GlcNAc-1-phosphate transferase
VNILLAFIVPLLLAAVGCGIMVWLAPHLGFTDKPGAERHKQTTQRVPYGGGAAMGLALIGGILVMIPFGFFHMEASGITEGTLGPVLLGAGGLFLLGLIDDIRPMRAKLKLIIQSLIIAFAVGFADLEINVIQGWPWLASVLAFWWCLILANAYNLMDHADGLSGSMAFISAVVLLATAIITGDWHQVVVWSALLGALGGFLVWNLPPAKIYMGDAGSLSLGFLVGAGGLMLTFWPSDAGPDASSPLAVLAPVFLAMLPIYDMGVVLAKRMSLRRPLMQGDHNHISHRLRRLGLSPRTTLATAAALQTGLAACALQLRHTDLLTGVVVLAQAASICLVAVLLEATRDRAV